MTEIEIITGNDEICRLLLFKRVKDYLYQIPNTFPHEKENDTGWTEFNVKAIPFHEDWNMLIGAYNRALLILNAMPDTAKQLLKEDRNFVVNFGVKNFFGLFENQLSISSCWLKMVDFAKWWNSVSPMLTGQISGSNVATLE